MNRFFFKVLLPNYFYVIIIIILNSHYTAFSQLIINSSSSPQQLVQNVLLGSGVTVTNIQFTGHATAIGSFNGQSTNLGIPNGVILATGKISDAIGPNNSDFSGDDLGQPGDIQLTNIVGNNTYDAAVLEFDFVPSSDTLKINYVFGSEEYPEYVCSTFNDIFAFFLSGPNPLGGNYNNYNIALIPETQIPVSINSINSGHPGSGYPISACTSLSDTLLYIDNTNGTTIQYDGFTKVLQAFAHVTVGAQYHFKISIADVSDGIYDSGLFLDAKSFCSFTVDTSVINNLIDSNMITYVSSIKNFLIYPNPFKDNSNILLDLNKSSLIEINLYNSLGKHIIDIISKRQLCGGEHSFTLETKNYAPGLYFLHIKTDNDYLVRKILIN